MIEEKPVTKKQENHQRPSSLISKPQITNTAPAPSIVPAEKHAPSPKDIRGAVISKQPEKNPKESLYQLTAPDAKDRPTPFENRVFWLNFVGIAIAILTAVFFYAQLREMRTQTGVLIAQSDSSNADASLHAVETNKQLKLAQEQADAAVAQVTALQSQVAAMNNQSSLATAAQIPFVFLKEMPQEVETLQDDANVKWSQVWHNSGGSRPIGLKIWSDCTDFLSTSPFTFRRGISLPIELVIGPATDRTIAGCEASYSYLKKLDDENVARGRAGDDLRRQFYVFGGADYQDFLGHPHTVEYCYQLYWDNRSLKFGFRLIPCIKPNNKYNCTDEECEDWNPHKLSAKSR